MDTPLRVALVRSDTRRNAVAEALGLVGPAALSACEGPTAMLLAPPRGRRGRMATSADTLSAALDIAFAGGADRVTLVGTGVDRSEYRREAWGRPVDFHDLNAAGPDAWVPLALATLDGPPHEVRVARPMVEAHGRVVLATLATDGLAAVRLGLATLTEAVHPADRIWLRGTADPAGWHPGRLRRLWTRLGAHLRRLDRQDGHARLNATESAWLRQAESYARNIVRLARQINPTLTVVDGFEAYEGDAPESGRRVALGAVVAGTAPLAVDAVAASVLGQNPRRIPHLAYAEAAGLGSTQLDAITVQGDPIDRVRQRGRPHTDTSIVQHWARSGHASTPSSRHRPRAGRSTPNGGPGH